MLAGASPEKQVQYLVSLHKIRQREIADLKIELASAELERDVARANLGNFRREYTTLECTNLRLQAELDEARNKISSYENRPLSQKAAARIRRLYPAEKQGRLARLLHVLGWPVRCLRGKGRRRGADPEAEG